MRWRNSANATVHGTATTSPCAVFTSASDMNRASSVERADPCSEPMALNAPIMPITVPSSPSMGPTAASTPRPLFSRCSFAVADCPASSTAGRAKR